MTTTEDESLTALTGQIINAAFEVSMSSTHPVRLIRSSIQILVFRSTICIFPAEENLNQAPEVACRHQPATISQRLFSSSLRLEPYKGASLSL